MQRSSRRVLGAAAIVLALVAYAAVAVKPIHWRTKVIVDKMTGRLPQVDWLELAWMLKPKPEVALWRLGNPPNPFAVISNPLRSPKDIAAGKHLFARECASCHGVDARGGKGGPSLHKNQTYLRGRSDWALFRTITHGIPGTGMRAWDFERDKVWSIIAYLNSLTFAPAPPGTIEVSRRPAIRPLSAADLDHADKNPAEWLTYSGSYSGQRHSTLKEIGRDNVQRLQVAWVRQIPRGGTNRRIEVSPIVRGSTMFVSGIPNTVYALDAKNGRVLWKYAHPVSGKLSLCCDKVNRGVALSGSRVFLGTLDAHLIALDANTGKLLWDTTVADSARGYSITSAPLALKDMVVTGMAGGDFPTRGFLDAYDAATGKRRWRFYTIPAPGEKGGETWHATSSYKTGGGATWLTGTFDPTLGVLYWGVGNPNPDFYGENRPGDNLYTDSVVALNADTGRLRWHFQFTPHDLHDWDSNQIPVLVDGVKAYPGRKLLAFANRNGFYYLLDRTTGQFLIGTPFVKQNWADGLDANGRPLVRPESIPNRTGVLVYPRTAGATNWWSPSYDPTLALLYVPTMGGGGVLTATPVAQTVEGEERAGSAEAPSLGEPATPSVKALDVATGKLRWQFTRPTRDEPQQTGGVMSTAGGLVFWGDTDTFFALDAKTGAELWHFDAGGEIGAAPISYALDGRQYIALAAGHVIYAFALPSASDQRQ